MMMDSTGFVRRGERKLILIIDNYDSFVFNLERYVRELGTETDVVRNDAMTVADVLRLNPSGIILSPGPCTPREAGICEELVRQADARTPILGVCLGHQAIASGLGGLVIRAPEPVHGRTSLVEHDATGLFEGCEQPLRVTRYHSLCVDETALPADLRVTARTAGGVVMGLEHRSRPLYGVQFHPESILTRCGHRLLANFLDRTGLPESVTVSFRELPLPAGDPDDFFRRGIADDALRPA